MQDSDISEEATSPNVVMTLPTTIELMVDHNRGLAVLEITEPAKPFTETYPLGIEGLWHLRQAIDAAIMTLEALRDGDV